MATSSEGIDVLDMKHYQFMACLSNMQGHLQQAASITTQQLTVHSYIDWWWSFKPTNGRCVQIDIHEIRDAASRMWYHLKEESSFEEMLRRLRESKEDEVIIEITNVSLFETHNDMLIYLGPTSHILPCQSSQK